MFFEKMSCFSKKCHIARHRKVCYVILAKEGKQKGQQVGQKNLSSARVNDGHGKKKNGLSCIRTWFSWAGVFFMPIFRG